MSATWMEPFSADDHGHDYTLPISEQFGPTIQGEGRHAGRVVQFLRVGGCNLSCSWCDTAYTWDADTYDLRAEITQRTGASIVEQAQPGMTVVLSGGEPMLYKSMPAMAYTLRGLQNKGCEVHVESNGTIRPNDVMRYYVNHYTLSPKLDHAGDHKRSQNPALDHGWLEDPVLNGRVDMKFVVRNAEDVNTVARLVDTTYKWPRARTFVMPLGTTSDELDRRWKEIAPAAAHAGINASHRLHVLAFGDTRGT